jgi:hypothetical protein
VASGLSLRLSLAGTLTTEGWIGILILLDTYLLHAPRLLLPSVLLLLLQIVRPLSTHRLSGVSDVLTDEARCSHVFPSSLGFVLLGYGVVVSCLEHAWLIVV